MRDAASPPAHVNPVQRRHPGRRQQPQDGLLVTILSGLEEEHQEENKPLLNNHNGKQLYDNKNDEKMKNVVDRKVEELLLIDVDTKDQ